MWHCHWFKASIFASPTSNVGLILFSTRNCDISPCGTKLSASCVIITASPSRSCVARPAGPTLSVHLKYFLSGWKYFYPGQNIFTGSVLCCVRVLIRVANARVSNMSADFHSLHSAAARTQNTGQPFRLCSPLCGGQPASWLSIVFIWLYHVVKRRDKKI